MSFLTKTATLPRAVALSATRAPVIATQRPFTTSPFSQKTATESVKDGLKKVDRTVSDNIAIPAVDALAAAQEKVKKAAGKVQSGEAQAEASAKASELKGEAAGKAQEVKGQAKGAAAQAAGKVEGAAEKTRKNL